MFLQTRPQVKNMNFTYYDLYYTVIKSRCEKEVVNDKDYIKCNDFFIPIQYIGRKNDNEILSYINENEKNEISN